MHSRELLGFSAANRAPETTMIGKKQQAHLDNDQDGGPWMLIEEYDTLDRTLEQHCTLQLLRACEAKTAVDRLRNNRLSGGKRTPFITGTTNFDLHTGQAC